MQNPKLTNLSQPHEAEVISIRIPVDTLLAIKRVATAQDIPYEALIKYYIGRGLREDLTAMMYDRVLEKVPEVLARHIQSDTEIAAIIEEIRNETVL